MIVSTERPLPLQVKVQTLHIRTTKAHETIMLGIREASGHMEVPKRKTIRRSGSGILGCILTIFKSTIWLE